MLLWALGSAWTFTLAFSAEPVDSNRVLYRSRVVAHPYGNQTLETPPGIWPTMIDEVCTLIRDQQHGQVRRFTLYWNDTVVSLFTAFQMSICSMLKLQENWKLSLKCIHLYSVKLFRLCGKILPFVVLFFLTNQNLLNDSQIYSQPS